jgi:hypothetical protein
MRLAAEQVDQELATLEAQKDQQSALAAKPASKEKQLLFPAVIKEPDTVHPRRCLICEGRIKDRKSHSCYI